MNSTRTLASRLSRLAVAPRAFPAILFNDGDPIVKDGRFVAQNKSFSYASVPLSVITSGAITILENGKAVKHLRAGEYFGVFETAYALRFKKNAPVGRWSLVADGPTAVVPLSLPQIRPLRREVTELALESFVPQPLSRLSLLDAFASERNARPHDDVAIIYHSHLLESTFDLLKHLGTLCGYQNVFVLEKPYSTMDSVFMKIVRAGFRAYAVKVEEWVPYEFSLRRSVDFVWDLVVQHARQHRLRKIIVLSDGGDMLMQVPWERLEGVEVIGVEQTLHGLERIRHTGLRVPPTINVASSRAKKQFETPYIAAAVHGKLARRGLLNAGHVFGVIGTGSVGRALYSILKESGETCLSYDKNPMRPGTARSLEELVAASDVIIGATGTDALRGLYIERLRGTKTFVSASSSNIEFAFLFDLARRYANSFEDVELSIGETLRCVILNGGYPINFDRAKEWEPLEDIQLTRTLLYAGILQALKTKPSAPGTIRDLNRAWQRRILELWKKPHLYARARD